MKPIIRPEKIITTCNFGNQKITITTMTAADLQYVLEVWTLKENWYPAKHVTEAYISADASGYYLLFLDDEPIASLSAVRYPTLKIAYLGLYIVIAEYRGKGYGKLLWDTVTKPLLAQGYTLGLNAAADKIDLYQRDKFKVSWFDEHWSYSASDAGDSGSSLTYQLITQANLASVIQYDASIFGAARTAFLTHWMMKQETIAIATIDANQITGYGVMSARLSPNPNEEAGYRIGPLYADQAAIAENIIKRLIAYTNKRPIILDVIADQAIISAIKKMGFIKKYAFACMLTKPFQHQNVKNIFAKTSLAISVV